MKQGISWAVWRQWGVFRGWAEHFGLPQTAVDPAFELTRFWTENPEAATGLVVLAWVGFFVPLIWVASPGLSFARYALGLGPLVASTMCLVVGLGLFYRSHADLGTNWSITLEVREQHRLITQGVYRRIRHPMYLPLALYSIGQAFVTPNWVAGPSNLIAFMILCALRIRAEERMMVEQFGDQYAACSARTKCLIPGVW